MSQQENIYELPLFKAHVLLLADIVADFSGRTELAEKGKVKELFLRQVKTAPVPDAAELQAAAETSTDAVLERALKRKEQQEFEVQLTPQGKVDLYEAEHPNLRPSRKALSRREMLRSLVRGIFIRATCRPKKSWKRNSLRIISKPSAKRPKKAT